MNNVRLFSGWAFPAAGIILLCLGGMFAGAEDNAANDDDPFREMREQMVERHLAQAGGWGRDAIEDENVLNAMRTVKRHEFVPEQYRRQAYLDQPLPIGHGQTISQPFIVAYMTELLELEEDDVVFEVGAGSGYHAAVIAEIVDRVYTVEIVEPLAESSAERLERLGYDNVTVSHADGYHGWEEHAPFDAIVVTAAASHIPPPLVEQLKPEGRMIIPVGPPMQIQNLMLVEKDEEGRVSQRNVMPVRFVPLTRKDEE